MQTKLGSTSEVKRAANSKEGQWHEWGEGSHVFVHKYVSTRLHLPAGSPPAG